MYYKSIPLGPFATNCIVLAADEHAANCWLVDPGADAEDLIAFLDEKKMVPTRVLFTHGHFDHIGAVPGLLTRWPSLPVHIHPADEPMLGNELNAWPPDYVLAPRPATLVADLADNMVIEGDGLACKVLHVPGHTPGGVCFYFESAALALTGDTLFAGSCGRTDFPGGNMQQMSASLKRLAALDESTAFIPGHGCGGIIGYERKHNPFIQ